MTTRRGFLAAGALALAGCGKAGGTATPAPATDIGTRKRGDIEVLGFLLAYEQQSVSVYERGGPAPIGQLLAREREHVQRLQRALDDLGGRPQAPLSPPDGDGLDLAERVENTALAAYLDAIPKLADPGLRALCAQLVTDEAEHLAAVRLALHRPVAPDAFVTGARQL